MKIIILPDPILKRKIASVTLEEVKNGSLKELILDMKKTMIDSNGVGLAANQVGIDKAVFVIDEPLADNSGSPSVFINPEITDYSKEVDIMEEGCLSIPSFYSEITRSKKIKIKAIDENGVKFKIIAKGLLARVLQHETDHLNGVTIKDRSEGK